MIYYLDIERVEPVYIDWTSLTAEKKWSVTYSKYFSVYMIRGTIIEITLFKKRMINCILRKFIY